MSGRKRRVGQDDAPAEVGTAGDGLRARFRKRQAQKDDHVEFGVAQANAYFNARRIKRAVKKPAAAKRKGGAGRKASGKSDDGEAHTEQEAEDAAGDDAQEKALVLPSRGQLLTALKVVDAREAESRSVSAKFALPCFDQHFPLWRSQILANQNLLFYGVGSKLSLLQRFAEQYLDDGIVMQLHGYLPTVSMRYLTNFVHQEIFQVQVKASRSLVQQCQDIVKLACRDARKLLPRVYLVIHSIDGMAMRTLEIQTCLSWLATASFINVIASIDQINGTSLWKEEDSLRFQWISQAINTCLPYSDEIELRLSKQSKTTDQSSSGIKFILQSLTPTDVATLQVIAQHQLAAAASSLAASKSSTKRKVDAHADYQKVYEVCRKRLLHSTILAMKNSVKCLEEHGLVKLLRAHNVEKLEIPLPEHLVRAEILQLAGEEASGSGGRQAQKKSG